MSNFNTSITARKSRVASSRWAILFILTLGLSTSWKPAEANVPQDTSLRARLLLAQKSRNAPASLRTLLTQIDAAANRRKIGRASGRERV